MKNRVFAGSAYERDPRNEIVLSGVNNPSHSKFEVIKRGQRCCLGVATYKLTGNKAVVFRKAFNWDETIAYSEFVVSTVQDEQHLINILDFARDMVRDNDYSPDKPYMIGNSHY